MASSSFDVDAVITKLLEVRGSRPGKQVNLTETAIRGQHEMRLKCLDGAASGHGCYVVDSSERIY